MCTKTVCMEAPMGWSLWLVLWNFYSWNEWHHRWASRQFGWSWKKVCSLLQRRLAGGQRKAYREDKNSGGMKRSVRIYLWREYVEGCGRQLGAKINIWMQNGKHDMLSTQVREMQKRRSLLLLKTLKETSFMSPSKCIQKVMM